MNIIDKNLNLLPIFEALYESGSVSAAAKKLRLSQPALSHALKNLRETFADELFARSSTGVVPTDKARSLWPTIKSALDVLRQGFSEAESSLPEYWKGVIRILSTEYFEVMALPSLLSEIEKVAPHVQLHAKSVGGSFPYNELENGSCDLAIAGFFGTLPNGFYKTQLFDDRFVGVAHSDHPIHKNLKLFSEFPHLLLSPGGDFRSPLDEKLKHEGTSRTVVAGLSSFLSPAWVLAQTQLLMVAPQRLSVAYAKYLPLRSFELPIKMDPIRIVQVWHERTHRSPMHAWIRKYFTTLF